MVPFVIASAGAVLSVVTLINAHRIARRARRRLAAVKARMAWVDL